MTMLTNSSTKRRVGDLVLGESFRTCLTRRSGLVVDVQRDGSVLVELDGVEKVLHPDVVVVCVEG